jgi:2-polyprenyl-3-methyl-5-hydroxy-6-metoxy-1,4-benzoquinol methylase
MAHVQTATVATAWAESIQVRCEREVASASPDHLMPWGTRYNNSRNHRFNDKLYRLFPHSESALKILDLGCSGGGFVKDCIDDGCLAIGLEGSDFSKKLRRAEWRNIPEYLFTCDVTGDFEILLGGERLLFDVVTCWELIEHLTEEGIERVAANVRRHLASNGLWIMSVSPNEEIINGVRLHQTVQEKPWWLKKFAALGFEQCEHLVAYFRTQFVRGPKYAAPGSFILILRHRDSLAPNAPKEGLASVIADHWVGSRPQRFVQKVVLGQ